MTPVPNLQAVLEEMNAPFPGGRMSASQLGDILARLVWESFSDYLVDPRNRSFLERLGITLNEGVPEDGVAEEILIFHMWAHSRAVQLAYFNTVPEEGIREILDHLHMAVFEDMVAHGTPEAQLPVFEQRVAGRYAEYNQAAAASDEHVGSAILRHLARMPGERRRAAVQALTRQAVELASPLRDYLEGVELVSEPQG